MTLTREGDSNRGYLQYYGNTHSGLMLGVTGDNPIRLSTDNIERVRITSKGYVGIGLSNPTEKFQVDGNIKARKIIVTQQNWPDYVFKKDYDLPKLEEVAQHIEEKKRLPEVPSAAVAEAEGVSLGDMQKVLLKKIEELTLYTIQQQNEIKLLTERLEKLEH